MLILNVNTHVKTQCQNLTAQPNVKIFIFFHSLLRNSVHHRSPGCAPAPGPTRRSWHLVPNSQTFSHTHFQRFSLHFLSKYFINYCKIVWYLIYRLVIIEGSLYNDIPLPV